MTNGQRDNAEPPHGIEAEMGLLFYMILSPAEVAEKVFENVSREKLAKGFFHEPRHSIIFEAMLAMREEGLTLDAITLTQKLRDMGRLELAGGDAYIADLISSGPITNWKSCLSILEEKFRLRLAHRKGDKGDK
jgi:replicative DNA helicase